jgi:hypothetical protein
LAENKLKMVSDLNRATVVPARTTPCFLYALFFQARQLRSRRTPFLQVPGKFRFPVRRGAHAVLAPSASLFISLNACTVTAFSPGSRLCNAPGTSLADQLHVDGRRPLHAQAQLRNACIGRRPVSITGPDGTVAATTPRESSAVPAAIDRRQQDRNFHQHPKEKP